MNSSAEKYVVDVIVVVRWIIRGEEWEDQALQFRNTYIAVIGLTNSKIKSASGKILIFPFTD